MSRRRFDKEFKVAAARLVVEEEVPVCQVAKELEVHPNSLYRGASEYEKYGERAFPRNGTRIYDLEAEINRLEKRNRELEEEVDLLKKFRVFLQKKST